MAAKVIDPSTEFVSREELMHDVAKPTQAAVVASLWRESKPMTQMRYQDRNIEFRDEASTVHYRDLNKTRFKAGIRIVKADGSSLGLEHTQSVREMALAAKRASLLANGQADEAAAATITDAEITQPMTAADNVGPINSLDKWLFQSMRVNCGPAQIMDSGDKLNYINYVTSTLTATKAAKDTWMKNGVYHQDEVGEMSSTTSKAHMARVNEFRGSRVRQVSGTLTGDFFQGISRWWPPGLPITVSLKRASDEFLLMHDGEVGAYRLEIVYISLYFRLHLLLPSLRDNKMRKLAQGQSMKIPLVRFTGANTFMSKGQTSFPAQGVSFGQQPRRMWVCFVDKEAFDGKASLHPGVFSNFNVNEVKVQYGTKTLPDMDCPMSWDDGVMRPPGAGEGMVITHDTRCLEQYEELLRVTGALYTSSPPDISMAFFRQDFCVFAFDLGVDYKADDLSWIPIEQGTVTVHTRFLHTGLPKDVQALIFFEYENQITYHRDHSMTLDYSI